MKKTFTFWKSLFLLCALIVGSTSSVWADDDVTFSYSDYKGNGTQSSGSEYTMDDKTDVAITESKFYCGSSASYAQLYASGVLTISPKTSITITKIELTANGTSYNGYQGGGTFTASTGSVSGGTSSATVTWEGEATSEFTISHSKQIRCVSIKVYYTKSGGGSTPSISANDVPIAYNATNGSIAYTINNGVDGGAMTATIKDGTTPTIGSFTLGDGTASPVPFTCTANSSVTAKTATVTLTYTYDTDKTVTKDVTITQAADPNAFNAITDITASGTSYKVKGTVVATNARGFVTGDGTGYVYTYLNAAPSQSVGDKLTINGTPGTYRQVLQFTSSATIAASETSNYNETPAATVVTAVPDYSSGLHLSTYLQFEGGLTKSGDNYFITLGDDDIQISYPTTAQATALGNLVNKTVSVKGYFTGYNSSSIFTVMLESVEEVVVDAHTLTVNATNGSVAIKGKTLDSNNQCEVAEDAEVEATATPAEHYTFTSWSATGVTLADATANPLTFTMPEGDVTLTATFTEMAKHTATFYVQGVAAGFDANVYEGDAITFPTNITVPTGYTLMGWTTAAIAGEQNTAPATLVTAANMGTTDVSYHAVFAIGSGSGSANTYSLVEDDDDLNDGDNIVIYSTGTYTYSQTQYSFSKANAEINSNDLFSDVDVTVSNDQFTSTEVVPMTLVKSGSSWKLKIGNQYVSAGNKIATLDNTGSLNTISITNGAATITATISSTDYKLQYNPNNGKGRFAYYSSTQKAIKIYKQNGPSYASYCTTVPETGTITLNAACNDGKGKIYGTYFTNRAYVMPATLKGSVVSVDNDGKLVVDAVYDGSNDEVVPANTALLISTTDEFTGTKDYTITYSTGGDDYSDYNMLKGTLTADETTAGENCKFYRLTMHKGTTIGFYWGAENGAAFTPGANKAYLAVPTAQAAKMSGFAFDDTTTGINGIEEVAPVNVKTRKVVKNGRLVIETANGEFTIDGARMK